MSATIDSASHRILASVLARQTLQVSRLPGALFHALFSLFPCPASGPSAARQTDRHRVGVSALIFVSVLARLVLRGWSLVLGVGLQLARARMLISKSSDPIQRINI